jgi:hypothetical protein
MSIRTLAMLTTFLTVACSTQSRLSLAADQPLTPVVTVVKTVGDQIGADLTIEVTNPNAFAVSLVSVDCMGLFEEKKYVYGPESVLFVEMAANSKANGELNMTVVDLLKAFKDDPDLKEFPIPTDIKCQVNEFKIDPYGNPPGFVYTIPKLTAPAG